MNNPRVVHFEWGRLEGERPRPAGSNARLGGHGKTVRVPLARITLEMVTPSGSLWRTTERKNKSPSPRDTCNPLAIPTPSKRTPLRAIKL